MPCIVIVSFGQNNEHETKLLDSEVQGIGREEASRWLREEFEALDCAPRNPIGKILLLDVILDVAKHGGEARFAEGGVWAKRFALCCAVALGRESIRVDIPNLMIG